MRTFQQFLKFKEEQGLFSQNSTGDTPEDQKDQDLEPVRNYPNSGFYKGGKGGGIGGGGIGGGGSIGGTAPTTSPTQQPSRMKKMKKDGGEEDASGVYTGTLANGLGNAVPVRMRKK